MSKSNWYVAHLLFAQAPQKRKRRLLCESCHVLLRAPSALKCYDRALIWAKQHEHEGKLRLVGVQHLTPLFEEPGDGSEIGGSFHERLDVWQRVSQFIPDKRRIPIIKLEGHPKTPVGKLMEPAQRKTFRRLLGKAAKPAQLR